MHKQVVIIGAGPSGLLLAQLLQNRNIDYIILENRNKSFLRLQNRGGFIEASLVDLLRNEMDCSQLIERAIPLQKIDCRIDQNNYSISISQVKNDSQSIIYDQKCLVSDLLEQISRSIIFEAKAQRFEGLEDDKVRIIYTLDGQLHDITCDYVVGCDGLRGISRKSIPKDLRKEQIDELPYAWLEWVADEPSQQLHPIIAKGPEGFAMCTPDATGKSRYYIQLDRGLEMDDLPSAENIAQISSERLGVKVPVVNKENCTLDYMRSFYTEVMQHGRLFIAGDAAHQVPRFGSKGINMAMQDAALLAYAFKSFYQDDDQSYLNNYSNACVEKNLSKIKQCNFYNQLFHKNDDISYKQEVESLKQLLSRDVERENFIQFITG